MKVYVLVDCFVEDREASPDIRVDTYTNLDDAKAELKKRVDDFKSDWGLDDEDIQVNDEDDFEFFGGDSWQIYIRESEVK